MASYTVTTSADWHNVYTLTLNELLDCGALSKETGAANSLLDGWTHYSDEQAARVVDIIIGEYGSREIGITPIRIWYQHYQSKMAVAAQQANLLYPIIGVDTSELSGGGYKERRREIDSRFPQTMLSQHNSDYASSGNDRVIERLETLNSLDIINTMKGIAEDIVAVDDLFVQALDPLFLHIFTPYVNGM